MEKNISYVWVTKGSEIPHKEKTHGIQNIINTALKCPNSQINVYVDSQKERKLLYELKPNIQQPKNIKFIPVSQLIDECRYKAKRNKHNEEFIDDAYKLYLLEMEHGHPAYAGNFIKLLALYKGGFVSDIGVPYDKKIFSSVKDVNITDRLKAHADKSIFDKFKDAFLDNKFHIATPPVLFWSGKKQNKSVYQSIKYMNDYYKSKDSLSWFTNEIKKSSLSKSKKDKILEDVNKIYQEGRHKSYYNNINNAISAIKAGKLVLQNSEENFMYKFQDIGYSNAVIPLGLETVKIEIENINHKVSHLNNPSTLKLVASVENSDKKIEEKAEPIYRTTSANPSNKYFVPTQPDRPKSAFTQPQKIKSEKQPGCFDCFTDLFAREDNKVRPFGGGNSRTFRY